MSLSSDSFAWVADLVRRRSAIQLQPGKEYLVESRLMPMARRDTNGNVDAWIASVRSRGREDELSLVVEALTTNETSWFRDSSPFVALRTQVIPALLGAKGRTGHLRIWSGACSTGQEPYSLAMTLSEALPPGMTFEILATDLSEQVLTKAKAGRYSQLEVNRGMPAALMVKHFTRSGADWLVSDELRRHITFRAHNLLEPPPGQRFDLVFLRNVLIYFDLPTKRAILQRVHRVLDPAGALFLGAAETTMGVDDQWVRVPLGSGSVYCHAGAPLIASASSGTVGVPHPRTGPPPARPATLPAPRPAATTAPSLTTTRGVLR